MNLDLHGEVGRMLGLVWHAFRESIYLTAPDSISVRWGQEKYTLFIFGAVMETMRNKVHDNM